MDRFLHPPRIEATNLREPSILSGKQGLGSVLLLPDDKPLAFNCHRKGFANQRNHEKPEEFFREISAPQHA